MKNISFFGDVRILLDTVITVFMRDGISSETTVTMEEFMRGEQEMVNRG